MCRYVRLADLGAGDVTGAGNVLEPLSMYSKPTLHWEGLDVRVDALLCLPKLTETHFMTQKCKSPYGHMPYSLVGESLSERFLGNSV